LPNSELPYIVFARRACQPKKKNNNNNNCKIIKQIRLPYSIIIQRRRDVPWALYSAVDVCIIIRSKNFKSSNCWQIVCTTTANYVYIIIIIKHHNAIKTVFYAAI
jgi:hypothetical protein